MKKKFILLLAVVLASLVIFSQNISPIENTEYCPLSDITFTVTLPRIKDNTQEIKFSVIGITKNKKTS